MSWSKYTDPTLHRCEFPVRVNGPDSRPLDKSNQPFKVGDQIICDVCGQTYRLNHYIGNYRDPDEWVWEAGRKVDFR